MGAPRAGALAISTPAGQLLIVWAVAVALFAWGPIQYNEQPRFATWLFVAACLALFSIGAWLATTQRFRRSAPKPTGNQSSVGRLEVLVRVTAAVGLFWALCIAIHKLIF